MIGGRCPGSAYPAAQNPSPGRRAPAPLRPETNGTGHRSTKEPPDSRQIFFRERREFLKGVTVGCADLGCVSISQSGDGHRGEHPNANGHPGIQQLKRLRPRGLQAAGGCFAENQQEIAAEITHAQRAEIIKGQERCAQADLPRAERRVKGHPDAERPERWRETR